MVLFSVSLLSSSILFPLTCFLRTRFPGLSLVSKAEPELTDVGLFVFPNVRAQCSEDSGPRGGSPPRARVSPEATNCQLIPAAWWASGTPTPGALPGPLQSESLGVTSLNSSRHDSAGAALGSRDRKSPRQASDSQTVCHKGGFVFFHIRFYVCYLVA